MPFWWLASVRLSSGTNWHVMHSHQWRMQIVYLTSSVMFRYFNIKTTLLNGNAWLVASHNRSLCGLFASRLNCLSGSIRIIGTRESAGFQWIIGNVINHLTESTLKLIESPISIRRWLLHQMIYNLSGSWSQLASYINMYLSQILSFFDFSVHSWTFNPHSQFKINK